MRAALHILASEANWRLADGRFAGKESVKGREEQVVVDRVTG